MYLYQRPVSRIAIVSWLTLCVMGLTGCVLFGGVERPTPTPLPAAVATATASPAPPTQSAEGWLEVLPGMETREIPMLVGGPQPYIGVRVVRIDPRRFSLRVHYDPDNAATVVGWQARTGATLVVNGGFFYGGSNRTLGLVVSDGQAYGNSFIRDGGMLSVNGAEVNLRSLAQFPYQPGERFDQAVQGRPMILYPGGFPVNMGVPAELARRTAVAQDAQGRLLFFLVDNLITLYQLRDWMADTSGLELFVALNLDGGTSSGMALIGPGQSLTIESPRRVPGVIAVYANP